MTDKCIVAGIQDDHFSSKFALDENYASNDNNEFLNEYLNTADISSDSNDTVVQSK